MALTQSPKSQVPTIGEVPPAVSSPGSRRWRRLSQLLAGRENPTRWMVRLATKPNSGLTNVVRDPVRDFFALRAGAAQVGANFEVVTGAAEGVTPDDELALGEAVDACRLDELATCDDAAARGVLVDRDREIAAEVQVDRVRVNVAQHPGFDVSTRGSRTSAGRFCVRGTRAVAGCAACGGRASRRPPTCTSRPRPLP